MQVLLVEDDDCFADALTTALRRYGHQVMRASCGRDALAAPAVDLVLLDLGLPDLDGIEVLSRLREHSQVGVIAVTSREEERARVIGLRTGADDYVVKPFGIAELLARMDAVVRRTGPRASRMAPPRQYAVGRLLIDLDRRTVCRAGAPVALTRKEFDLLALLLRARGDVLSRERILLEVWRTTWRGVGRSLEVHVASLRAKLDEPGLIETVRGVGYRLGVPAGVEWPEPA